MAFSLSSWFKGKSPAPAAPAETPAPPAPAPAAPAASVAPAAARPAAQSATVTRTVPAVRKVVPNSVQPVSLRDPGSRPPVSLSVGAPPSAPVPSPMTMRPPVTNVVPPRKISFGNLAAVAAAYPPTPEPPAFTPPPESAPEPASVPDVPVQLTVGDFIDRVPATLLVGGAVDRERPVEFRSSELYSDLTKGRASVPASVIYAKCPDLFSRPVDDTEDAEVALPLAKLVEQLTPALQTRADQVAEENVGEIETPFLQVAMEDNARLPTAAGTVAGAIRPLTPLPPAAAASLDLPPRPPHRTGQIQAITALKVAQPIEPVSLPAAPNAASIQPINPGKRPPSTVRASVAGGKIRLSGPTVPNRISITPGQGNPPPSVPFGVPPITASDLPPSATQRIATPPLPTSASPSLQVTKKTQRIQIPPISLRSASAPASPAAPRPPVGPPAVQPSPVTVRQNGGEPPAPPVMFHSSPTPPEMKLPPPSFAPPAAPSLRPAFPPPAFPAMPPLDVAPAAPAPTIPAPAPADDGRRISLGLAAVLRGLSSSLLAVEPSAVPDDVRIELPFSPVESQLATGRVSVGRGAFVDALPAGHKEVLDPGADLPEIPLPLQEVFMNLPSNALTMRQDQVEEQVSHLYPTPFSQKAEEDAQRLGIGEIPSAPAPVENLAPPAAAPVAEPETALPADEPAAEQTPADGAPAPATDREEAPVVRDIPLDLENQRNESDFKVTPDLTTEAAPEAAVAEVSTPVPETVAASTPEQSSGRTLPVAAKGRDSELQVLFMTEEELDAKTVVKLVSQMPGIDGCTVMFGDGLRLAGNFPSEETAEGFSAMAPPFFKRAKNFTLESGIGTLQAFTIYTDGSPCSFLMHDDICLAVRHSGRGFMPGVREKLEIVVRELARMYSSAPADLH